MINLVPKKQWVVYLLWLLMLALVLAGIWWCYSHKIDKLDRQLKGIAVNQATNIALPDIFHPKICNDLTQNQL